LNWVHWAVGALWLADGVLCVLFPGLVRALLVRAYRESRYWSAAAAPALAAAFLAAAARPSGHGWLLLLLALFSLAQAAYLYRAIRAASPRVIETVVAFPDGAYRAWGLLLAVLGPLLIALRPA
jgi:hypothetical protein